MNLIKSIVQTYPEITEKYLDFLTSLNISFDEDVQKTDLDLESAEKFIVSFKLQRYIKKLENEKQTLLSNALNGENYNQDLLNDINNKITDAKEKLELLIDINK